MKCEKLKEMIKDEEEALRDAIKKHQQNLSNRRGYIVEFSEAEMDFADSHLEYWADGFRHAYCNYACDYRNKCEIIKDE